jgi:hypothetical protein
VSQIRARMVLMSLVLVVSACGDPSRILSPDATNATPKAAGFGKVSCVVNFTPAHAVSSAQCSTPDATEATDMTANRVQERLVIGGQNVYVTIGFSNFAYNSATNLFSLNVTVQNLMAQPLGTTDGVTAATQGTRIFVVGGPSVTSGSGTITIPSDSGTATFTAPNQIYWQYDGILKPDSISKPSNWKFVLPSQTSGIQFVVEVSAPIPAEASVLRWTTLRQGLSDSSYNGVWQQSSSNIYAVGNGSTVARYNGSSWSLVNTGLASAPLSGVYGFSASDLWVVGGAVTAHYNGSSWTSVNNTGAAYKAVWGTSSTNVYAVGYQSPWAIIQVNNGSGFNTVANDNVWAWGDTLRAIYGLDANDIWVAGDAGVIGEYVYNQYYSQWETMNTNSCGGSNVTYYGLWASSNTNVYAVGSNGTICRYNGTSWAMANGLPANLTATLTAIGGSSANDIWVTGQGGVTLHYNGSAWTQTTPVVGTTLLGVTSGSASSVAVVGSNGTLLNYNGSTFALSPQAGLPIYGIWGTDSTDIYASSVGTVLHYNGTTWTSAYAGATDTYNAISGPSDAEIFTVGSNGDASVYNGSAWTDIALGTGSLNGVYAINANLVFGCGNAGVVGYYNGSGYVQSTPAKSSSNLMAIWGDAANDVYTVASDGTIGHLGNGTAFTSQASGTTNALNAVHGLTGVDVWAAGNSGTVTHYTVASGKWTAGTAGTSVNLHGVFDAGNNDVYTVGDAGTIQHYNGSEWLSMPSGVSTALRAVHGTSETVILVGGDNGVVLLGTR